MICERGRFDCILDIEQEKMYNVINVRVTIYVNLLVVKRLHFMNMVVPASR